jgi:DNA-binding NarL/FixJ family response regulator
VTIRVLIADDHAQLRAMVAEVLEEAGFEVCAQAATGDRAVELAIKHEPDVALLDIRMRGDGITAARRIAAELPKTGILMLTVSADAEDVLGALQAGARGYVLKGASPDEIADAVRAVHEGAGVIAPGVASVVVSEIRRSRERYLRTASGASVQLTEREWAILELLDQEKTTTEIASDLFVAPVTIRTHIASITRKLEVDDRRDALTMFRTQRAAHD